MKTRNDKEREDRNSVRIDMFLTLDALMTEEEYNKHKKDHYRVCTRLYPICFGRLCTYERYENMVAVLTTPCLNGSRQYYRVPGEHDILAFLERMTPAEAFDWAIEGKRNLF